MTALINAVMATACLVFAFVMLAAVVDDRRRTRLEHKELYVTADIDKNQT